MGIRMPGQFSGIDPKTVEKLMEAEKIPVEQAKKRRDFVVEEKAEFEKLSGLLSDLDTAVNGLKSKTDFYKMAVESSHPDIMEGTVNGFASLGSYEFEVRGLAKSEKELAFGFPDKASSPVGFGFMMIERQDQEPMEVVVEPDSTLNDVVRQINDSEAGVRAMVINTGYKPDPYRLLVISEESGEEAKITIDEDTTFLEFKEQVTGRNLDILFEDVPVTDADNNLDELVDGINFNVKRSEPGTRVQINITYDLDATVEGIQGFVDKYNEVVRFAAAQSANPKEGSPGRLSGDGAVRQVMRQLQSSLFPVARSRGKFSTLGEIGISTNPKTGELSLDNSKVRGALTEDYDSVAGLFIRSKEGPGVGERLSDQLRSFRNAESGVLKSKMRGLDRVIDNQDKVIERRERQLEDKQASIKRRFAALDGQMADLQSQSNFLAQRFGGKSGGGG